MRIDIQVLLCEKELKTNNCFIQRLKLKLSRGREALLQFLQMVGIASVWYGVRSITLSK